MTAAMNLIVIALAIIEMMNMDLTDREKKIICIMGCFNFPGFKESPHETKDLMIRSAMLTAGLKYDEKEMPQLAKAIQDTAMAQYTNGLRELNKHGSIIRQLDKL